MTLLSGPDKGDMPGGGGDFCDADWGCELVFINLSKVIIFLTIIMIVYPHRITPFQETNCDVCKSKLSQNLLLLDSVPFKGLQYCDNINCKNTVSLWLKITNKSDTKSKFTTLDLLCDCNPTFDRTFYSSDQKSSTKSSFIKPSFSNISLNSMNHDDWPIKQHFFNFLPELQGQGSFLPIFWLLINLFFCV